MKLKINMNNKYITIYLRLLFPCLFLYNNNFTKNHFYKNEIWHTKFISKGTFLKFELNI